MEYFTQMLDYTTLLPSSNVILQPAKHITCRKQIFTKISDILATENLSAESIIAALHKREQLGSTYISKKTAFPHGRCKQDHFSSCFLCFDDDVDYGDKKKVRYVFGLLVPDGIESANEEYLLLLKNLSNSFRNDNFLSQLDQTKTQKELFILWQETLGKFIAA